MKNIEFVKGILITPDGQKHPFGKQSYESVKNPKKENYHDSAFNNEILPQPWFQKLQEELGFEYTTDTLHRQSMTMAAKGIIVMLNGSNPNQYGEYNVYCIHTPKKLSSAQKEVLENDYLSFKEVIERKNAYFEADGFDENENYIWNDFVYNLDEFYDRMNLNREEYKGKGR